MQATEQMRGRTFGLELLEDILGLIVDWMIHCGISERAIVLGQSKSLVGILTRPVDRAKPTCDIAVVILNTRIIHRVGPTIGCT